MIKFSFEKNKTNTQLKYLYIKINIIIDNDKCTYLQFNN